MSMEMETAESLSPGPHSVLVQREEERLLLAGLRRIPLPDQVILELHYWEDLEVSEIAQILAIPTGTARNRLRRAHKELQVKLGEMASQIEDSEDIADRLDEWVRDVQEKVISLLPGHKEGQILDEVQLSLDRPVSEFDEAEFKEALEEVTGVPASLITVLSVREGSTILRLGGDQGALKKILDRLKGSKEALRQFAEQTGLTRVEWTVGGKRYVLTVDDGSQHQTKPQVLILLFAANPSQTDRLAVYEEVREIKDKIKSTTYRDVFAVEAWEAAQPDDLLRAFNEKRPHVVHFCGHGSADGLIFHCEGGRLSHVSACALQKLFSTMKGSIRAVLMNACYSEEQAKAIAEVIDCVVGVRGEIGDLAARRFATAFYQALGFGHSVKVAYEQGCTSIALNNLGDDHKPVLIARHGVDAAALRFP